jgi:hypothetical protein
VFEVIINKNIIVESTSIIKIVENIEFTKNRSVIQKKEFTITIRKSYISLDEKNELVNKV